MSGTGKRFKDTTHISVATVAARNATAPGGKQRVWGMLVTVIADNTTYELKRGLASTNILDNSNWQVMASGGGGTTTLKSQAFAWAGGNTGQFTVSNGTIDTLLLVEANGSIQREGVDFTITGQLIDFGGALPGTGTLTVFYFEALSLVKPDYTANQKTVAGTAYTLLEADLGFTLLFTNAGAITITVPPGLSNGWQTLVRRRNGAGAIAYLAGAGVTIEAEGLNQATANTTVHVEHIGGNTFILSGNLT
jgi:hypothetical protein